MTTDYDLDQFFTYLRFFTYFKVFITLLENTAAFRKVDTTVVLFLLLIEYQEE